jgi:hypothetical protein
LGLEVRGGGRIPGKIGVERDGIDGNAGTTVDSVAAEISNVGPYTVCIGGRRGINVSEKSVLGGAGPESALQRTRREGKVCRARRSSKKSVASCVHGDRQAAVVSATAEI